MYGFSEQNFDVTSCTSVISSIAFSKCTKFFNTCLIELPRIITKSRAELNVILNENYCIRKSHVYICIGLNLPGVSASRRAIITNFGFRLQASSSLRLPGCLATGRRAIALKSALKYRAFSSNQITFIGLVSSKYY